MAELEIPMVDIEDLADTPQRASSSVVEAEQPEQPKPLESPKPPEAEVKRKPGRPAGSKSKEPGKPRAPRKKRVEIVQEEEEVQEEVMSSGREERIQKPRVLPGSHPIPTHSHNDTTALMLSLLQQQAHQRQRNKTELWKSWFK